MSTHPRRPVLGLAVRASAIGAAIEWEKIAERKRAAERRYRAPWMPRRRRENPAGTKLARQAEAGACTLRGRVPNGTY